MNKLKHLIVIPTGGLCNRLRVIASVLKVVDTSKKSFGTKTKNVFVILKTFCNL